MVIGPLLLRNRADYGAKCALMHAPVGADLALKQGEIRRGAADQGREARTCAGIVIEGDLRVG